MAFFDNSQAKIFYECYGTEGSVVVLVNGYTRPCGDFKQLASFLAKQNHRVLIFDNRGSGLTEFKKFETLGDIADDILSLTDFLGFSTFHLVGFSMGAVVSRLIAHEKPECVKSLSLVSAPSHVDFLREGAKKPWGDSLESIEEKLKDYIAEDFWLRNEVLVRAMAKNILEKMKTGFKEGARAQREALLGTPSRYFSLKGLELPVLVVHGSEDLVIPISQARVLVEQKRDSEFLSYSGAGHLLLLEKGKELYGDLASFIARCD